MPRMVYIQQMNPATFLHFSTNRPSGFCPRDYSIGPGVEPVEIHQTPARPLADVDALLDLPGNIDLPAPDGHPVGHLDFWHRHTRYINKKYITRETVITPEVYRKIIIGSVLALIGAAIGIVSYKVFGVKLN